MNKNSLWIAIVIVVIVFLAGVWFALNHAPGISSTLPGNEPNVVSYACAGGAYLTATFVQGSSTPGTAGGPPTPGGNVMLALSDGRTMTLPQTISADGARYANADESFVFWTKGNGAFTLVNKQPGYQGCIRVAPDVGNLPQVFESGSEGFSLRYPAGYTSTEPYTYEALGPGKGIGGVKFTISSATSAGTNLSSDSYISVEEIQNAATCDATRFLAPGTKASALSDAGTDYSFATSTDAGAGNRYEEYVYAIPGTNPCMAVRYFIHYGAFENYSPGTVKQFDESALLSTFDSIRRTLIISSPNPVKG